jgi:hypothetical protein
MVAARTMRPGTPDSSGLIKKKAGASTDAGIQV